MNRKDRRAAAASERRLRPSRATARAESPTMTPRFKDRHLDLQHLVRELVYLRTWNMKFKEGASQAELLMFSECAVVMIAIERFFRLILGARATDGDTLDRLI